MFIRHSLCRVIPNYASCMQWRVTYRHRQLVLEAVEKEAWVRFRAEIPERNGPPKVRELSVNGLLQNAYRGCDYSDYT